jgi:hypothetical protein
MILDDDMIQVLVLLNTRGVTHAGLVGPIVEDGDYRPCHRTTTIVATVVCCLPDHGVPHRYAAWRG